MALPARTLVLGILFAAPAAVAGTGMKDSKRHLETVLAVAKLDSEIETRMEADAAIACLRKAEAALGELVESLAEIGEEPERRGFVDDALKKERLRAIEEAKRTLDKVKRAREKLVDAQGRADKLKDAKSYVKDAQERVEALRRAVQTVDQALSRTKRDLDQKGDAERRRTEFLAEKREVVALTERIRTASRKTDELSERIAAELGKDDPDESKVESLFREIESLQRARNGDEDALVRRLETLRASLERWAKADAAEERREEALELWSREE